MYLLMLGIALVLLKYLEVGPVAQWSWLWVLSPFGLTLLWWGWADSSGYTKRKAMEKIDQRKQDRLNKQKENLGMRPNKPR
ncbi:TIGR04438 family Trp-rich protein [Giesbergeria anulus]|uniref:Small Trp-rich protein n=1 Tax=Giesbergeria anulus TaxID=180197 RepID=A0A1H9EYK3_9BURK|nr:TIGR04438 family Trp-rich protein [Giesbergeria anulus]SEQ30699.1 small Trp-rich protein [Giesbergeria anulus]